MKVALVSPYSWTTPGGANIHIAALAAELRARGHEVRILAPADGEVPAGVIPLGRTIGIPFNGSIARIAFGPRLAARVRVALRRARPDVVHVHEPFAPSASMLAVLSSRVPVVATFHADTQSRIYRAARMPLRPLWSKIAVKIAVSPAARASVERVLGPGARVIPNGVDVARYAAIPEADPAAARVLYFGRFERRKGPQVLAEAVPRILEAVPAAEIVLAGDGPLRPEIEASLGGRSAVRFTGRFDDAERVRLLGEANVVCLPALGGESFGYTVAEAMAAGRAIVASDIPGFAAVLGDAGVLVPPGDVAAVAEAVAGLLRDPARAAALGRAARERARRFDWPVVAAAIEASYVEAVERASAKRRRRAFRPR